MHRGGANESSSSEDRTNSGRVCESSNIKWQPEKQELKQQNMRLQEPLQ